MGAHSKKRDRTARLLRIQMLLGQNPEGLKIKELAELCSVDVRTIYRDLRALETELNVPVWQNSKQRGLVEGYNLPSVPFSLMEATYVFLAVRLLQNFSRWYDQSISSTFTKLEKVVPPVLKKYIQDILDWEEKQPKDEKLIRLFELLVNAWLSQHRIKILYQDFDNPAQEYTIDPYFIDPTALSHGCYIIGYDHTSKSLGAFRLNHIEELRVEPETFSIPSDFNALEFFNSTWGLDCTGSLQTVKLHFIPRLTRAICAARYHPTQVLDLQEDGSLIMTVRVKDNHDFRSWILSWGDDVEVLEPQTLRESIIKTYEASCKKYASKDLLPIVSE
jgi:predicted DNA-binding transcriptional regulator YafY